MRSSLLVPLLLCATTLPAQDAGRSTGWVVIPVNEYGALRSRAYPVDREPEPQPVEATLSRVDYELQVDTGLAAGRAILTVDVLKDGWVRVPIPAGLNVRQARADGKPLSLVPGPAGKSGTQLSAMLTKKGRIQLLLDIALPIGLVAGDQRLSLPPSVSGVTRASVTLGRQDVDVRVTGGILSTAPTPAAPGKWLAFGRANEPLVFAWRRKSEDHRVTLPLRFRGSLTELAGVGEDSTSIQAQVNVDIVQGSARQFRVQVPDGVNVNQVQGGTVADWEVKGAELLVTLLDPAERSAAFVILGDTRLPRDGAIGIPLLHLLDAERESGGVAVEILGAGEIKNVQAKGVEPAEAASLGPMVASRQSPSLAAFRFMPGQASRSLTVEVARYAQQAVLTANVEEARYRVLVSSEGKTLIQARYAVRNNQRNFLKLNLPAGAAVWSASSSGNTVHPGQAPDGGLLLPLAKTRAGDEASAFPVEILFLARAAVWNDKGRAAISVPAIDLPVSRTGLVLYYPPAFKVTPEPGAFRTEAYQRPPSPALNADAGESSADERAAFKSLAQAPPAAAPQAVGQVGAGGATQALVDKFRAGSGLRKDAGPLPIRVSFPAVGPTLYLVSELTGENQAPALELSYQKDRKGGAK